MAVWASRTLFLIASLFALSACSPSAQFAALEPAPMAATGDAPVPADRAQTEITQVANAQGDVVIAEDTGEAAELLAYASTVQDVSAVRADINRLIDHYAREYNVPAQLIHKVVKRESNYNPGARNGVHRGLMQLNPGTARTMGFRGPNDGLYDPDANLRYGVKYLRGALLVAQGNWTMADKWYQRGYYYEAKRMGLLEETGLRP